MTAPETPAPSQRRPAWPRIARLAALAAAVAAATAGAGLAGTLWRSEAGTRWVLRHVPGLTVVDPRGSFGGGDLRAASLRVVASDVQVDIAQLRLTGLALRWHPHPGAWIGLSFDAWTADAVRVTLLPSTTAATPPASLRSPVALDVASLRVGSLVVADGAPLRDVRAALSIGADGGRLHRVDHLSLGWERIAAEGSAQLRTDAPFALDATLAAHDTADAASALPHWQAHALAQGPLAGFDLAATLQGEARDGRAAPQATATARVTPFAALPVNQVQVRTTELDLRALSDRAPSTRLQGTLRLATTQPAALDVDLHNLAPAAWSAGGLPFASLSTHLEAPWNGTSIAIPSLRLVLADATGGGGELRGQGRWEGEQAQVQLDLDQLRPARLDAHLGDWRIAGPLRASLAHLPTPAALWHGDAVSFGATTAQLSGRLAGTAPPPAGAGRAVAPPPMALQLDAQLRADALQLKQFDLQAGTARLSATGALDRDRDAAWHGDLQARWTQLDPNAWWRLTTAGPNALNGSLALHLAGVPSAWRGLAGVHAKAELVLADSQFAGLPLAGQARVDALAAPWKVSAELHSGDNQAHLDGTLHPGNAHADALSLIESLHLGVDAPALQSLSALAAGNAFWPTHGAARLDVQVDGGTGPLRIATQGELSDVAAPRFKLAKLQWSGHGSSDPQAPLDASVTLADAQAGIARLRQAHATLSGTLAQHRLAVDGEAPVSPPAWLAHLADIGRANATRLEAVLQGRWQPGAADAPAWQAHVAQLDLRAANDPRATDADGTAPAAAKANWLHVQPFDFSLSRDAAGDWQTLRVGAGGAQFAGLALAWQPSFWSAPAAPDAPAHWAVDAALAPFQAARLLARVQPDLGWQGDLTVGAQLHAAFDGQWHLAAEVARSGGDLGVSELVAAPNATRLALGLTRASASLKAEGAAWVADTDIAGSRLGELSGHWTAQAPSPASLPTPDSPLRGQLKARVDDLNVWGAWLPPGWRLGGELHADIALSGRWGDPQLTGELTATQLAIRNALEGVHGHDGELAIRLSGDQARIERFRLQGGNGELTITGGASLGAVPKAKLELQARQFQLLGRIDRKIVTSGDVALRLGTDAIQVDGKLGIDEGLFDLSKGDAPSLDADVEVLDANASADADDSAAAEPKPGRATQVDLAVDLGDHLRLRGRGIDTTLKGALQISSPGGVLAVRGKVRTAGGQYVAYGQKLNIQRGEITFSGPVADPRLDILAVRPNIDTVVGVAITGTALAPHVRLMSDPEMSDSDKLSWLMLGRAPETEGAADSALLQQAAMALLAGEGEAPSDQVLKRLGLTNFSVGQKTDTDTNTKQTVVSLGRQISDRVYAGYERSVTATAGNWQLIYRIAQRLTVRAQSGVDTTTTTTMTPSWSLDAIYTWRWN